MVAEYTYTLLGVLHIIGDLWLLTFPIFFDDYMYFNSNLKLLLILDLYNYVQYMLLLLYYVWEPILKLNWEDIIIVHVHVCHSKDMD